MLLALAAAIVAVEVAPGAGAGATHIPAPPPDRVVAFGSTSPRPALPVRVVVLGDDAGLAARTAALHVDGVRLEVEDASRPQCPLDLVDAGDGPCAPFHAFAETLLALSPSDAVVVLGLGSQDRQAIADAHPANIYEERLDAHSLVARSVWPLLGHRLLVVDGEQDLDPLAAELGDVDLRRDDVAVAHPDDVGARLADLVGRGAARTRVMVIGDSTSFELAKALDDAAGSQLDVVWAGRSNCPLVPVVELRWWPGATFDRRSCPSVTNVWPEVVARRRPQIVLAVASLAEQADQRYAGDPAWHGAADPAYVAAHDAGMEALQGLLAASGAVTVLAIPPPMTHGYFSGGAIGTPARLAGWWSQLERWDRRWISVGRIDWGARVVAAERAAGRPLRFDGVHLELPALRRLVDRSFVAELEATAAQVEAASRSTGCLTDGRLELPACVGR